MADHTDVQHKITGIVTKWELENYALFLEFLGSKKAKTANLSSKFATLHKGDGNIERLIHEIPEKLYLAFQRDLSADELEFFYSKEASIWFAKTFPQYRIAETV